MPEGNIMAMIPALISPITTKPASIELASREMSMDNRYPVASVSKVFKENILLNIAYLDGRVTSSKDINWSKVTESYRSEFTLKPNEVFAYHNGVLPQYKGKVVLTTNTRFNQQDGYKTDGYLYGDGVCQLASLLNWAAKDAKLDVYAPANHDFAMIPEVPKEYGVAIYFDPNDPGHSASRNLYITNNQDKPITFVFDYDGGMLKISVTKAA
jgi:hypothetical protein